MLCVSTAKAYFPDRQSCSTLCRQPSGCARSVEVVAVYPSLGSYSVVGLFWWTSPPSKNALHPIRKKIREIISLFKKFFENLLLLQKGLFGFVDYALLILPSIYKGMGAFKN